MTDAKGEVRLIRAILLAHIADYPEQQLIACVASNTSPVSVATYHTLGSSDAQELRHGTATLLAIRSLRDVPRLDLKDLPQYSKAAVKVFLNGVTETILEGLEIRGPSPLPHS